MGRAWDPALPPLGSALVAELQLVLGALLGTGAAILRGPENASILVQATIPYNKLLLAKEDHVIARKFHIVFLNIFHRNDW